MDAIANFHFVDKICFPQKFLSRNLYETSEIFTAHFIIVFCFVNIETEPDLDN